MTNVPVSLFAPPRITAGAADQPGLMLLRSAEPLGEYPVTVLHSVRERARLAPDRPMVAERTAEGWRTVGYGEAVAAADAIGQALLDRGLGPDRPLLILSGNSVDHLLVALGAMTAGVPVAPVSVAYSLASHDHARIRAIADLIAPGAVFAEDAGGFGPALDALPAIPAIVSRGPRPGADRLSTLLDRAPGATASSALAAAFAGLRPDGIAKILFTSGSTGTPKGVLNTHRMLSSNQQMIRQAWPFLAEEPPVIVDWLPWSHTFGGNHMTPGYFARPDLTLAAFDEEGFYRAGDAVGFAEPGDPNAGLVFRGRIAEDFKLETGTFVRVGAVRTALLSAVPVLSDVVLTGENRDSVCALAWLNAEARRLLGEEPEPDGDLIVGDSLRELLARALADHNDASGSSARIARLLVMARPASLDAGEITDKGYVNQRKVLVRRAALVELLYADPPPPCVIVAGVLPACPDKSGGLARVPVLNAASKDAEGGSKSNRRRNSSDAGAPASRSMPASSHSTEIGPA